VDLGHGLDADRRLERRRYDALFDVWVLKVEVLVNRKRGPAMALEQVDNPVQPPA
jgi:hypothetical protein